MRAVQLMTLKDSKGEAIYGQREIERETGLSRPYLRKLSREIGHQFPRNGFEVKGKICMCTNCGWIFRKPPSRVKRAKRQFCDDECRQAWLKGANHPSWKGGVTLTSFSSWVKNQAAYRDWQKAILERDNYTCQISGRKDNLEAHHIVMKAESHNPEKVFDLDNGITVNKEVHTRIHQMISEGIDFEEALGKVKEEFAEEKQTQEQGV
jgi:5-methylcytosine-specific restriction endonuclease McrA